MRGRSRQAGSEVSISWTSAAGKDALPKNVEPVGLLPLQSVSLDLDAR